MKYIVVILLLLSSIGYAQLSMESARAAAAKYPLGSYSYHEQFLGYKGYGAPVVLTADGGAAMFGDYQSKDVKAGLLVKLDKNGKDQWKRIIRPQFDEIESQSVVQDRSGNYYVFMLSYDSKRYRGGSQRVVCLNKVGTIVWDKTFGKYEVVNNPIFSYIRALDDGRISLRGHMVSDKPEEGKDPKYRYWEGWIDNQGKLTQQTGDIIDWAKQEWQNRLKPE